MEDEKSLDSEKEVEKSNGKPKVQFADQSLNSIEMVIPSLPRKNSDSLVQSSLTNEPLQSDSQNRRNTISYRRGTVSRANSIAAWKIWQNKLVEQQPLGSVRARRNTIHTQFVGNDTFKPPEEKPPVPDEIDSSSEEEEEEEQEQESQSTENTKKKSKLQRLLFRKIKYIDGTMAEWSDFIREKPIIDFIDYCFRGAAQVVFMNNPISGIFIIGALFVTSIWGGICGLLGLVSSTLFARILRLNMSAIRGGLFGYNGILVGLALATFMDKPWSYFTAISVVLNGMFSTIFTVALGNLLAPKYGVPPFTLPFNFVVMMFLLSMFNFSYFKHGDLISPSEVLVKNNTFSIAGKEVVVSVFRGVGQVYLADNYLSGVLILLGTLVCSRISAVFMFAGSLTGVITAYLLGANVDEIYFGLWGYNAVLGCMAVGGIFYTLNATTSFLAILCAILCTILLGTTKAFLTPWGMPSLTFPFCLGTIMFVLMQGSTPGAIPVELATITTAEGHLKRHRKDVKAIEKAATNEVMKEIVTTS